MVLAELTQASQIFKAIVVIFLLLTFIIILGLNNWNIKKAFLSFISTESELAIK